MSHDTPDLDALFPIRRRMAFFNHAGVAPISGPAAAALRTYADQAESAAYLGAGWYRRIGEIRSAAARLIGARGPGEIAFVPNTTSGLAQVANGIDWRPGDSIIITNVEYPANRYPWENIARRNPGVELIEVDQLPDGRIDPEDVCEEIRDRTRIVAISHVQYASGHRVDLKPISDMIHRVGGWLCVDAIQSVGVTPVDVQAMGIDFLAADGHKWMLGPEGCGIFYCRQDLAPLLHPTIVGWMNMVDAENYGDYRFELLPDARRFEPGSFNVPGILALGASIDLLLETGVDEIWRRVETLTARLCDGLADKGYRVFTPRKQAGERSGIVIFEPPAKHELDEAGLRRLTAELARRDIVIVVREGRLRASPHFYNSNQQIDQLIDALP